MYLKRTLTKNRSFSVKGKQFLKTLPLSAQFFFFRSLCCLSFDLRIMITAFVSSNSSYLCYECYLFIIDDLL